MDQIQQDHPLDSSTNVITIKVIDDKECEFIVIDRLYVKPSWDEHVPYVSFCKYCHVYCELWSGLDATEGIHFWIFEKQEEAIQYALTLHKNHVNDAIQIPFQESEPDVLSEQEECSCHFIQSDFYQYHCHHQSSWESRRYVSAMDHLVTWAESFLLDNSPRFLVAPIKYYDACQ